VSKAKPDNRSHKTSPDLDTPTDLPAAAVDKLSAALNALLADAFALYLKTKNFHWHVSGRHFHDYHLMFDEQSEAIFSTTDQLAERVRKIQASAASPAPSTTSVSYQARRRAASSSASLPSCSISARSACGPANFGKGSRIRFRS